MKRKLAADYDQELLDLYDDYALLSFVEFPPRQEATSFSIEKQMQAILKQIESQNK